MSLKKTIITISIILLVALSAIAVLEFTNTINLVGNSSVNKPETNDALPEVKSANPTNTVDYGPANPSDDLPVPDKNPTEPQPPVNSELSATITSTRKSSDGKNYLIKVAVIGTTSGSCEVTASKGSLQIKAVSSIDVSGGQYSCIDLKLPMESLKESGTWNVEVTVKDPNGYSVKTASTMEVIL